MRLVKIITMTSVIEEEEINASVEMVGQKAIGLFNVPLQWRLPFFVIHKEIFDLYKNGNTEEKSTALLYVIKKAEKLINEWKLSPSAKIIIRSSGKNEGMEERGKYDSEICKIEEMYETLQKLYDALLETMEEGIAYIVQPYIERKVYGHLSNERRVSQVSRDWKAEFENSEVSVFSIGIRHWRTNYDERNLVEETLYCEKEKKIKETLRRVAYYYTMFQKGARQHLEFVWSGKEIYIVQNDREELVETAEDPTTFPIKINNYDELENFNVLRKINESDGKKYRKVQNVLLYEELGLTVAPLYILDDRDTIVSLTQGVVQKGLEQDIRMLLNKSMVIRTDVDLNEISDVQFLPRSNELRDYEAAMEWFQKKLPELLQYNHVAMLIHIFIPAISAAFAYATPKSKIVTIQSLWGLPEGLYYNAHDTFLLDTGTKNVQHIDIEKIKIVESKGDYKEVYIAPDEKGKWKEKKVKVPYDWRKSITDLQAKIIAKGSRIISQKVGLPLSIMWFVGIDKEYYHAECLPWFHEEYGDNTFSHDTYKKKYYTEKEIEIASESDLEKYENDTSLRTITIHPKDDETLRSRQFISKVGEFAKRKGVTIFLEGTVLAHPVYRLMAQGVHIVLAKRNKELIDRMQFDKLVRDRIPGKINDSMETVQCYKVNGPILIRYLKEKLVEETFEFLDASSETEKCQELADMYEVLLAIQNKCSIQKRMNVDISRSKRVEQNESDKLLFEIPGLALSTTEIEKNSLSCFGNVTCNIERLHQNIEFEFKITANVIQNMDINTCNDDLQKYNYEIIKQSYDVLDAKNSNTLIISCDNLRKSILREVEVQKMPTKKFQKLYEDKRSKNGGFDEGFVLHDTAIHTEGSTQMPSGYQFEMDLDEQENYPVLNELLFRPVTYIDFRNVENAELILRIKYPLCFETWENEFTGVPIENMFGEHTKIIVNARRKGMYYYFRAYIRTANYEQLELPDL